MRGGGSPQLKSGLNPTYQKPIAPILQSLIGQGLTSPQEYFPGYDKVAQVYDPTITNQYFQQALLNPTITQLTGPYGIIPRIGATAAQAGDYFSSGRQEAQANAALNAMQGLGQQYAALVGEDQNAAYQEYLRTQALTSPLTQQALNYLGTPMLMQYQTQPSPWAMIGMSALSNPAAVQGAAKLGSSAISAIGSTLAALFSDVRLKKNIFYVESNRFPKMAVWEWNEIANTMGLYGHGCGYIAQDVEKVAPDSVITLPSGYKGVLYRV